MAVYNGSSGLGEGVLLTPFIVAFKCKNNLGNFFFLQLKRGCEILLKYLVLV